MSTDVKKIDDFIEAFGFLMDSSLLGIGVGFDTKGKGRFAVFKRNPEQKVYVV